MSGSQNTNTYDGLRNIALNMTPERLQVPPYKDEKRIFGVVMDWDLGDGIATLTSFETGDASMYLSSGGGVIGGIGNKNVSNAAKSFVALAKQYYTHSLKTDLTPLPDKNSVIFYFLTTQGIFMAQESVQNFENNTSIWLPFFQEGNKVITELRKTQDVKVQQ